MIGCGDRCIQIRKTIILKALQVILAQVESYHFNKSLSLFHRLLFVFGLLPSHLGHLFLEDLATHFGLTLTLGKRLAL